MYMGMLCTMRVVVGFATRRADDPGADRDRDLVRRYCRRRRWKLLRIYRPAGGQAAIESLEPAMRAIVNGRARGLVIARLSSVGDSTSAIRDLYARLQRSNATLVAVEEDLDTSRRDGAARLSAFLDGADWRRQSVGQRISEGQSRLASRPEIVERIHSLRHDDDMTLGEIADLLHYEGVPTTRDGRWWASTIQAALRLPRPTEQQIRSRAEVGNDTTDSPGDAPTAQSRTREAGSAVAKRRSGHSTARPSGKRLESDRRPGRKRAASRPRPTAHARLETPSARSPSSRRRKPPERNPPGHPYQQSPSIAGEEIATVVRELTATLTLSLTALGAGEQDVKVIRRYSQLARGPRPDDPIEARLRALHRVMLLVGRDRARAWLEQPNPRLKGQKPIVLMYENRVGPVLTAAKRLGN